MAPDPLVAPLSPSPYHLERGETAPYPLPPRERKKHIGIAEPSLPPKSYHIEGEEGRGGRGKQPCIRERGGGREGGWGWGRQSGG